MSEERVESEGFYEMVWDCDHCGTRGLLGKSQRHCAQCGAPQNPDKRYFPTPEQQKKIEGHSYVGADRHCPSCQAPMAAKANNCAQCGSPLDGAKEVRGVVTPVVTKRKRRLWPWILGAILIVCFAIWWFFIRKTEMQMTVTAHRWERSITIEEYGPHAEGAWRDALPATAQAPVCYAKQRTTRDIADGEDCHTERVDKKDGTFEQVKKCKTKYRHEPVLADWCDYTIIKWNPAGQVSEHDTGMNPAWPTRGVPSGTVAPTIGAKRQGARSETLTIVFGDKSCDVDDATWRKHTDGQRIKLQVRARSGEIVCSSL